MARKTLAQAIVKRLFALSGNVCAFSPPRCFEAMVDEDGNVIGEICHIEAAEPGGERYNLNQTDEQRRSFENLILLCPKHHKITNDFAKYPVEALQQMKAEHEQRFRGHEYEVPQEVINEAIRKYENYYTQLSVNNQGVQVNNQGKIKQQTIIYNYYSVQNDKQELTIIEEIFENVLKQIKTGAGKDYRPDYSIDLTEKIKLNFKNPQERKKVEEYMSLALLKRNLIKKALQLQDPEEQKDVHAHILGSYNHLTIEKDNNIEILHLLFDEFIECIAPAKKHDSRYLNLVKAFVLFFFEDCTIFERTKGEKGIQMKLDY